MGLSASQAVRALKNLWKHSLPLYFWGVGALGHKPNLRE